MLRLSVKINVYKYSSSITCSTHSRSDRIRLWLNFERLEWIRIFELDQQDSRARVWVDTDSRMFAHNAGYVHFEQGMKRKTLCV